ncbi:PilZ domain-containing protein [Myxococcaceae bacterium JPH2]|nr:PilZ domain-containing protein [Myxococcaceae bacterium JPH2]
MQKKGTQKAQVGAQVVTRDGAMTERSSTPVRPPMMRPPVEVARPVAPPVKVTTPAPQRPNFSPIIEANDGEPEHRHFPRAQLATRFDLWMEDEEGGRRFSASLTSINVSVSGAFLESTFFLPLGTVMGSRFALEDGAPPVEARAEIVREERGTGHDGRSGFALRFLDFSGQTEVALARLFLGMRLRAFAEDYLKSQRARSLPNELERVVDVLAAWELMKATSPGDPWRGE